MSKIVEADIVVSKYPYAPVNVTNFHSYSGVLNFAAPESEGSNPFFGSESMTAIPYDAKVVGGDLVYLRINTTESFNIINDSLPFVLATGLDPAIPLGAGVYSILQGYVSISCMALVRPGGLLQLIATAPLIADNGPIAFPPVTITYFKAGPGYFDNPN